MNWSMAELPVNVVRTRVKSSCKRTATASFMCSTRGTASSRRQHLRQGRIGRTASTRKPAVRYGAPRRKPRSKRARTTTASGRRCRAARIGAHVVQPVDRLAYINTLRLRAWTYEPLRSTELAQAEARSSARLRREAYSVVSDDPDGRGHLRAIDPFTGKSKWELALKSPNIVRHHGDGRRPRLHRVSDWRVPWRVDADTGKVLWQFQMASGIVGQPITWERDGKQYVTVTERSSAASMSRASAIRTLANVPPGVIVWTFKLFE